MSRKTLKFILTFILIIVLFTMHSPILQAVYEESDEDEYEYTVKVHPKPSVTAPSVIIIESRRGQVLFQTEADKRLNISVASKIMTALLAVEKEGGNLNSMVTISKEAVEAEGSVLNLEVGAKYSVEDLLYGIVLTRANDAARAVAEYIGGNIDNFVSIMNKKADDLGLLNTSFANPTGLFDENQYTTASDLAVLVRYAVNNLPDFDRIFSTKFKVWHNRDGSTKILQNQNDLYWSYDGIDGGKTGFVERDKLSVITTATRGNQRFICIVLDGHPNSIYNEIESILNYSFANFRTSTLVRSEDPLTSILVGNQEIDLVSKSNILYTHPVGQRYIKDIQFNTVKDLTLPIDRNRILGTARYILEDNTAIDVSLYSSRDILLPEDRRSRIRKVLEENRELVVLIVILLAVEVLLIVYHFIRLTVKAARKIFIATKQ